ncbi:uncharacterized protein [Amphiura filiformis]|uniref:uncharacterized protein n=1 Tax=Amphiura filiformis TaxID=82378 RepID=UPI003B21C549
MISMGKVKKCAICAGCTAVIIVVLVGSGAAGWGIALSEYLIDFACNTLKLLHSQLEDAHDSLQDILGIVAIDTGIEDPLDDVSWLVEPSYYTMSVVNLTDQQEQDYLKQYGDIFLPKEDFDLVNETEEGNGQLGALVDSSPDPVRVDCLGNTTPPSGGRRKRSAGYSRICPAYVPGPTKLVSFKDGGSGAMVQLNNYVQWVFNEECYNTHCSPGGCSCRKVQRQEMALVYVINSSGQLSDSPIQKTVNVHSCVAVV